MSADSKRVLPRGAPCCRELSLFSLLLNSALLASSELLSIRSELLSIRSGLLSKRSRLSFSDSELVSDSKEFTSPLLISLSALPCPVLFSAWFVIAFVDCAVFKASALLLVKRA